MLLTLGRSVAETERLILVHNEKTKATVTLVNSVAIALFGGGVVLPIVNLSFKVSGAPAQEPGTLGIAMVWGLVATGIHWWARNMLEGLR